MHVKIVSRTTYINIINVINEYSGKPINITMQTPLITQLDKHVIAGGW